MDSDEVLNSLFSNLYQFGFVQIECFAVKDGKSETYFITLEQISSFSRFKFYSNVYTLIHSCSIFEAESVKRQTINTLVSNSLTIQSIAYIFNNQELDMIIQIFSTINLLAYTFTSLHIDECTVSLRYDLHRNADLDEFVVDYHDVIELIKKGGKKIQLLQPSAQSLVRKLKLKDLEVE